MQTSKFLAEASLGAWLDELAAKAELIVPKRDGNAVVFGPYDPDVPVELSQEATAPPKSIVFPPCEELMHFTQGKDPEDPTKPLLQLEETMPSGRKVVFGARPCGARGFTIFDPVFGSGEIRDPYYEARRADTAFITLACAESGAACFCHWVGSGPADATGSDVLLIPVEGGYVAEAITEKGAELVASSLLTEADANADAVEAFRKKVTEALEPAPALDAAPESLLAIFDDMDFWGAISSKCISCGACTYLCPTCYCFNFTDESRGMEGKRLRTWDNCMSFQFTQEASGHNPRPTKGHRLKNRVGHKFSYYPGLHEGAFACCGCGRCIKSCPAGVDIREIVLAAMAHAKSAGKEQAHD
jgi:sulfhydrogenase subunit beta (sulfur reductase)